MGAKWSHLRSETGLCIEIQRSREELTDIEEFPEVSESAKSAIGEAEDLLQYFRGYIGNNALVQKAMSTPGDDAIQREAFEGMFPNIIAIKKLYNLSKSIDNAVLAILKVFLQKKKDKGISKSDASLIRSLVMLCSLVFSLDWAKLKQPAVQNDFSFYRRALSKYSNDSNIPVDDSTASSISMFIANASPLLSSLTNVIEGLAKNSPMVCPVLADFVAICCSSIRNIPADQKVEETEVCHFYFAMTLGITLYDRLDAIGMFGRNSAINMKVCTRTLSKWESEHRESCFSTLQYSTRHFNKAPSSVTKYFS